MNNVKDIVVVGSGNPDIVRLIDNINSDKKQFNFIGFLEKDETLKGKDILGYPVLGSDDLLLNKFSKCGVINNVVGTTALHETISNKLLNFYKIKDYPNLVHPNVDLKFVNIGKGNIIYNNALFGTNIKLGDFNIIYPGTNIGHETLINDFNLLALNVVIGARCSVGDRNVFGNSSSLSLGLTVKNDNFIGIGSSVIKNIDSNSSLLGNPAINSVTLIKKLIKENCF